MKKNHLNKKNINFLIQIVKYNKQYMNIFKNKLMMIYKLKYFISTQMILINLLIKNNLLLKETYVMIQNK